MNVISLTSVDSTNRYLAEELRHRHLPSGFTVIAEMQTHGRGQTGNSWESEPAKNLLFSVYFQPIDLPANRLFVVSEMASLCVKYTLDTFIPDVTVKWPNDIYYRDKKIAGILIENVILGGKVEHSIIGIGININQVHFLSDAPNPVSLAQITGIIHEKTEVLQTFHKQFMELSNRLNSNCFDEIHNAYLHDIYRKEGTHKFRDAEGFFEATIHNIEPSGHLIFKRLNGRFSRYAFKEVAYL